MSRVMVLAAGLGTRLRPLTNELPKPLVPIGDRSILAHVVDHLVDAGFDSAVLNTHFLPEAFVSAIASLPIEVQTVHEPRIRGTAGGVAGARHLLGPPPVLVWNGDILVEPPVSELLDEADQGLCMGVAPRPLGEGTVGLDERGRVVRLRGERFGQEAQGGDYVGVAALGARCLARLPPVGCLVGDVALPALRRGEQVRTVPVTSGFTDAGTPAAYAEANRRWLDRRGLESWVGPGATVPSSVRLRRAIVGAGAQVVGSGSLTDVVVWPGAKANAPLRESVVTTGGNSVITA